MSLLLLNANSLQIPLADKSVHCCVTSPPYWGLRDYGTATWIGGNVECDHKVGRFEAPGPVNQKQLSNSGSAGHQARDICPKCGAVRIDNQLGLEAVPDCLGWATGQPCGVCYICHTVAWAREVRRVLRDDGTFWLNIGDSYASNNGTLGRNDDDRNTRNIWAGSRGDYDISQWKTNGAPNQGSISRIGPGLKPKDLCGIPWRVAFALQADGWYLRSDIIWAKPNPMPESVTDRPTKSHEYLFLLAKAQTYYYDQDAIREDGVGTEYDMTQRQPGRMDGTRYMLEGVGVAKMGATFGVGSATRNRRSVWNIATAPYSGAHFATYPPALVEPCIKAGTSERGCCPTCGKGWERVVEGGFTDRSESATQYPEGTTANRLALLRQAARKNGGEYSNSKQTIDWQPACDCPASDPIPAVVLDPFAGSGTTLMVARQLKRNAVGLDLSYSYLHDQARSRLDLDRLDAWTNGKKDGASVTDLPLFMEQST